MKPVFSVAAAAVITFLAGSAFGQDINMSGPVAFSCRESAVAITAQNIADLRPAGTVSGTLALRLWACSAFYCGGTLHGYSLAHIPIGQLRGGQCFENVSKVGALHRPPAGTYYTVLEVAEWTGQAWTTRDFVTFSASKYTATSTNYDTAIAMYSAGRQLYDNLAVPLVFPTDHGFHFNKDDWIYFSGVLKTVEGKEFGIMFTIFQYPLMPRNNFYYPCMLAVSDPDTKTYYAEQSRGFFNGKCEFVDGYPVITSGSSRSTFLPSGKIQISSSIGKLAMDLELESTTDVLLHGEDGIITMGDGIDSAYYSLTNLSPGGNLSINGQNYTISSGRLWMDHQWGNFTEVGQWWDWFSLRFDDGGALMLFQFRDFHNNVIGGNWTYRDATGAVFYGTDFSVTAKRTYVVPRTSIAYPVDWNVAIPSLDATFEVKPIFDAQTIGPQLWEGLCTVQGTIGVTQLTGDAFVELYGYAHW